MHVISMEGIGVSSSRLDLSARVLPLDDFDILSVDTFYDAKDQDRRLPTSPRYGEQEMFPVSQLTWLLLGLSCLLQAHCESEFLY